MNLTFFKDKVEEKFGSVEKFAKIIGLTKPAIYKWIDKKSIPKNRLFKILTTLDLPPREAEELLGVPPTIILFRKLGRTKPEPNVQNRCESLANTFFKLFGSSFMMKTGSLLEIDNQNPLNIVTYLRKFLSLDDDEPIILPKLLAELRKINVSIFFTPFGRMNYEFQHKGTKEVAFTAKKGNKVIIFVDTERTVDCLTFDIIHELVHLICKHGSNSYSTEEDEILCNDIAQELVYPNKLFSSQPDNFHPFLNAARYKWEETLERFQELREEYNWSPMGLALALCKDNKYIKNGSHEFNRLMKMHTLLSKTERNMDDLFFSSFDSDNFDSLEKFFSEDIQKNNDIFKFMIELKNAATYGNLSPRRLAEIFGIDSGDSDELVSSWKIQEREEDLDTESAIT